MEIDLVKGDITEQEVDIIVNAANSNLAHGGGVARAIAVKAGPKLEKESRNHPYVAVGSCGITTAGNLNAKYVIHAVGPRYGIDKPEDKLLASAIRSSLELANMKKAKSIAFPAISTGIFTYPLEEAAEIIITEMLKFANNKENSIEECRLVIFSKEDYTIFNEIFIKLKANFENLH